MANVMEIITRLVLIPSLLYCSRNFFIASLQVPESSSHFLLNVILFCVLAIFELALFVLTLKLKGKACTSKIFRICSTIEEAASKLSLSISLLGCVKLLQRIYFPTVFLKNTSNFVSNQCLLEIILIDLLNSGLFSYLFGNFCEQQLFENRKELIECSTCIIQIILFLSTVCNILFKQDLNPANLFPSFQIISLNIAAIITQGNIHYAVILSVMMTFPFAVYSLMRIKKIWMKEIASSKRSQNNSSAQEPSMLYIQRPFLPTLLTVVIVIFTFLTGCLSLIGVKADENSRKDIIGNPIMSLMVTLLWPLVAGFMWLWVVRSPLATFDEELAREEEEKAKKEKKPASKRKKNGKKEKDSEDEDEEQSETENISNKEKGKAKKSPSKAPYVVMSLMLLLPFVLQ
ncbi:uncharacterized protein MONOS_2685 [Monocercomonoides exilis]|uniref:uncharacterized protein n=1 Tax=Monocercomonoides exilis TaxID=2049356 RepID=UPI003559A570|nr:hypothetical protein MONOS_2685 [Monocercomonoides exilis]